MKNGVADHDALVLWFDCWKWQPDFVCALQIAQKPFRLTDDYVAPKGALIMPSIVAANMQVSSIQRIQHMRCAVLLQATWRIMTRTHQAGILFNSDWEHRYSV